MGKTNKIENAYKFISTHKSFNLPQLVEASGWTQKTAEKSLWKIGDLVRRTGKTYTTINNFEKNVSLEKFKEAFSQTRLNKQNGYKYQQFLDKSKNAVLSAVQNYNNPLTTFRTENFIILMTIGFTALFHAIFEKNGWPYIEQRQNKTYLYDLTKCFKDFRSRSDTVNKYDKTFLCSLESLIEYFKSARDLIEHQLKDVDDYTYGHCQSWLFCYEHILKNEFGDKFSLKTMLTSAIQFSNDFAKPIISQELEDFHQDFYSKIPDDVKESPFFKLKVRIIPYKNIANEDLRQSAIFVNDPEIVAKYAETDRAIFVNTPKKYLPSEMVDLIKPVILEKYGKINFTASHLAKIAQYMGWIKNKKITNGTFMSEEKIGPKTSARRYKEGAEKEIVRKLNDDPIKFLKSFASKTFFGEWFDLNKQKINTNKKQ